MGCGVLSPDSCCPTFRYTVVIRSWSGELDLSFMMTIIVFKVKWLASSLLSSSERVASEEGLCFMNLDKSSIVFIVMFNEGGLWLSL